MCCVSLIVGCMTVIVCGVSGPFIVGKLAETVHVSLSVFVPLKVYKNICESYN